MELWGGDEGAASWGRDLCVYVSCSLVIKYPLCTRCHLDAAHPMPQFPGLTCSTEDGTGSPSPLNLEWEESSEGRV